MRRAARAICRAARMYMQPHCGHSTCRGRPSNPSSPCLHPLMHALSLCIRTTHTHGTTTSSTPRRNPCRLCPTCVRPGTLRLPYCSPCQCVWRPCKWRRPCHSTGPCTRKCPCNLILPCSCKRACTCRTRWQTSDAKSVRPVANSWRPSGHRTTTKVCNGCAGAFYSAVYANLTTPPPTAIPVPNFPASQVLQRSCDFPVAVVALLQRGMC